MPWIKEARTWSAMEMVVGLIGPILLSVVEQGGSSAHSLFSVRKSMSAGSVELSPLGF